MIVDAKCCYDITESELNAMHFHTGQVIMSQLLKNELFFELIIKVYNIEKRQRNV